MLNAHHEATDLTPATYPASWYVDPQIFAQEQDLIFGQTWQYAGPADHVARVGQYMTCWVGDIPIVVTRADDERLHAFINVCRHRYARVAEGCGESRFLRCPYHAWSYRLDGSLVGVPRGREEDDLDRARLGLKPVQVERWGPLIFVNLAPDPSGLQSVWRDIPDRYAATGLEIERLRFRERRVYDVEANWKVATENILECYHCPVVHPSYTALMDLDNYDLEIAGECSIQSTKLRPDESNASEYYEAGQGVSVGLYAFVFPNFMLNVNPGMGHFHTNFVQPVGVGRAQWINDFFFVPEVSEDDARDYIDFQDQVSREDLPTTASAGAGSAVAARAGIDQGRLVLNSELTIAHFQSLVRARLAR